MLLCLLNTFCFIFMTCPYVEAYWKGESSHGNPQKFFQGVKRRYIAYLFQVADVAMQMNVQNALLFLHHKENAPWKHASHSHLFWNLFQMELYTSLPQSSFCHPLQLFLNWQINLVITVNSTQLSLKRTWTINNYVCGFLISLCWLNRARFWTLLSNCFLHLS